MTAVRHTARALAADRSTKLLPIIVAQLVFIGAVGIAIGRTASAASRGASSDTVFINIEAHSIAFSAQYFWIIPAVFLSSVIGVSQTEAAIPRILRGFQIDLDCLVGPKNARMSNQSSDGDCLTLPGKVKVLNNCLSNDHRRVFQGGVYSWKPSKPQPVTLSSADSAIVKHSEATSSSNCESVEHSQNLKASRRDPYCDIHDLLAYTIVILGTVTGLIVSALVPPEGFDCRHLGEILLCALWNLSAQADTLLSYLFPLSSVRLKTLFWATAVKDFLATAGTMGGIVIAQIGVFNRCSCYTQWGKTGLALPQRPDVAATLLRRITRDFAAVTFTSIGIELVIVPLFICFKYRYALRVFVQRDDRSSNAPWLWKAHCKLRAAKTPVLKLFLRLFLRRSKPDRRVAKSGERGLGDEENGIPIPTHKTSEEPESIQAPPKWQTKNQS